MVSLSTEYGRPWAVLDSEPTMSGRRFARGRGHRYRNRSQQWERGRAGLGGHARARRSARRTPSDRTHPRRRLPRDSSASAVISVLMDVRMPKLNGIAATRILMQEGKPPRVLVLTNSRHDQRVRCVRALSRRRVARCRVGRCRTTRSHRWASRPYPLRRRVRRAGARSRWS